MKVRARLTKRRLLLVLIGGAGVMALLGPDAAGPLRRTVHYALAPLGDALLRLEHSNMVKMGRLIRVE